MASRARCRRRSDPRLRGPRCNATTSGGVCSALSPQQPPWEPPLAASAWSLSRDEVIVTDPTYAGMLNRVRLVGAVPQLIPMHSDTGEWRLDLDALRAAASDRT